MCKICDIIKYKDSPLEQFDIVLLETEHLLVFPCKGPLMPGNIMIVTKHHIPGFACSNKLVLKELEYIINKIKENGFYSECLFAEHGTLIGNKGGNCIDHAHLHVFPNCKKYLFSFENIFSRDEKVISTVDLLNIEHPYLMLFHNPFDLICYKTPYIESQFIRRAIALKENLIKWDWRGFHNKEFNSITLKIWNNAQS